MRISAFRARNWDSWVYSGIGVLGVGFIGRVAFTGCMMWFRGLRSSE